MSFLFPKRDPQVEPDVESRHRNLREGDLTRGYCGACAKTTNHRIGPHGYGSTCVEDHDD